MQTGNDIHLKIIRLFTGDANPGEKRVVGDWLNLSESNRKLYNDLKEIWLATGVGNNADHYNIEKAIAEFRSRTGHQVKRARMFKLYGLLKYAAIIILLMALPVTYFTGKKAAMRDDSVTTITCAFGDKSTVTLPDGSQAWLNSGSTLTFKNNFHSDSRLVYLEGEAYFSVKKNEELPFVVKAADVEVEVLGTKFNMKAYPDEAYISTTLVEGSIKIKSSTQQAVVKPNQMVVFDNTSKKMAIYSLNDISAETGWKDGRLVFRNESLGELEHKLERWFDVDIVFADELVKKRRFSGILERESILEAVSYFNYSKYVGYKIEGNEITFYSE
ncbi:MAG: DUF4974 domain-containing protein [Chlorobi bacterium]|nr:DUF4974 domain-containing protein [Chlorobiota bacterium]